MTFGYINKCETFGSVDGPGIRYVVFMQGCPMRCKYCHNPETWSFTNQNNINQIPFFKTTAKELLDKALRYKVYWGNLGGITVSGGEPLCQIDFLIDFFSLAKKNNIHTCIDTSGIAFKKEQLEKFNQLIKITDLFLVDIKHIDNEIHKELTGHDNKNILEFLHYLNKYDKPVWIRHVLVPSITDIEEYLLRTRDFIRTLNNIHRIEILPYHTFALSKYEEFKIDYPLKETLSPTKEQIIKANQILEVEKYNRYKLIY